MGDIITKIAELFTTVKKNVEDVIHKTVDTILQSVVEILDALSESVKSYAEKKKNEWEAKKAMGQADAAKKIIVEEVAELCKRSNERIRKLNMKDSTRESITRFLGDLAGGLKEIAAAA